MKKLLCFELFKLRKRKSFYVCTGIMLLMLFVSVLSTKEMLEESFYSNLKITATEITAESLSISNFRLIAGIFVVLYVCEDFEQQTIKNIVSMGYSPAQAYFAKTIVLWIATSFMFVLTKGFVFAFSALVLEAGSIDYMFFAIMGAQYLAVMAELAFGIFIALLLRKTGRSVSAYIILPLVLTMVLYMLIDTFELEYYLPERYWLLFFIDNLSYLPAETAEVTRVAMVSPVYIALFLAAAYFINRKRDI